MRTLPEALRAARSRAGLATDRELADYLGVGQYTVSRWMKGRATPTPASIPDLAPKLGLTVEQLELLVARARRPANTDGMEIERRVEVLEEGVSQMQGQLREILDRLAADGSRR